MPGWRVLPLGGLRAVADKALAACLSLLSAKNVQPSRLPPRAFSQLILMRVLDQETHRLLFSSPAPTPEDTAHPAGRVHGQVSSLIGTGAPSAFHDTP